MCSLLIKAAGPLTSVQDMGRVGVERYGLAPSGAMDKRALAEANTLVDMAKEAAAIEIGPFGFSACLFESEAACALTGASRSVRINGMHARMYESLSLKSGDVIEMDAARNGAFSYLAFQGGLAGDRVFGSLSVNARAQIGAPYPRPLQAGDVLHILPGQNVSPRRRLIPPKHAHRVVRIILGPQQDRFHNVMDAFLESDWTLSTACDRMGYRLNGPRIHAHDGHDIISDGTVNGSIQIPGDGCPIVLMPDRGTTGGYPKIATVITPDLGMLAQMPFGQAFRFVVVDIEEAQRLCRLFYAELNNIQNRLLPTDDQIDEKLLALHNIAGNAVSGLDVATWQDEQ